MVTEVCSRAPRMVAWVITRAAEESKRKLWQFGQMDTPPPTMESQPSHTLYPEGFATIRAAASARPDDGLGDMVLFSEMKKAVPGDRSAFQDVEGIENADDPAQDRAASALAVLLLMLAALFG